MTKLSDWVTCNRHYVELAVVLLALIGGFLLGKVVYYDVTYNTVVMDINDELERQNKAICSIHDQPTFTEFTNITSLITLPSSLE